jgi:uncharacterized protein (TIGR02246 family)
MQEQDVTNLFNMWNEALATDNPKIVTELYAPNAVLLPTISNQVRHNHKEIEDYFELFLENKPKGVLLEQNFRIFDEIIIHSGISIFTFGDDSTVKTRFSFVYQLLSDVWKIIEHHSSRMPE